MITRLLNTELKIYRKTNTGTSFAPVWVWTLLYTVYGLMDKQSGSKTIRNEGGAIISDWKCYLDIMTLTPADRIVDGADVFEIISIHNPNKMNHHQEIECKYLPAGTLATMGIGTALTGQRVIQMVTVSASAIAGKSFTSLYAMDIKMVMVDSTAAVVGGVMKLRTGTNDITGNIICAVVGEIELTETIAATYKRVSIGQTLNIISGGVNERGIVYIIGEPV